MKFYDEFDLLDHFNKSCGRIADYVVSPNFFQELDAHVAEVTIPCDMQFHDVDEWWGLDINGQNFMTLYLETLKELQDTDEHKYEKHFEIGMKKLQEFPTLYNHFKAKMDGTENPEADMVRYLPHRIAYVYNHLLSLEGVKKLNDIVSFLDNVDMNILLVPTQDTDNIHAPGVYDLFIALETCDGKPLISKFTPSTPKQQLN